MQEDKTQIAVDLFNEFADQYRQKYMDIGLYVQVLDRFCQNLPGEEPAVLDIACGPGNISRYLLEQRPDLQILGIDLAPKMLDIAREQNPKARFELMDIKQISQIQQSFEGIVCGFGLPYLNKEEAIQLIQDAFGLLTKGGLLYLSTMEGDYSSSGWQQPSSGGARQMFIHFHEASYLIQALRNSGFQDIEVHMQDFPEANGVLTPEILLLAQKP